MPSSQSLSKRFLNILEAYLQSFSGIPEEIRNTWIASADKTPSDNLCDMIGWWESFLSADENNALPTGPLPGFDWKEQKAIELAFEDLYGNESLKVLLARCDSTGRRLARWLEEPALGNAALTWLQAFAVAVEPESATASGCLPAEYFFIRFTESRRDALLRWKEAVRLSDIKPPHALWWY